jgi:hypothetical protein
MPVHAAMPDPIPFTNTSELLMRLLTLAALALMAIGTSSCSSQQAYSTGQAMQRNECNKISDFQDRQRCMEKANMSHDAYQRQAEAARSTK